MARRPTLDDVHATFRQWFGDGYDLDAIDVVLAAGAAERLDGDPLWLLLISGSGNAKTETVCALSATGAIITSTISSDGALLSASPTRDRAKDATGGLLRRLGASGTLVIKDITSILSMDRNSRATVLAALREVADGMWVRHTGSDGGRTLTWTGRIAVIGACTTAWDRAHDVIASMGDRFVTLRMDSSHGRQAAGDKAMKNTGDEVTMRKELAAIVARVLAGAARHIDKPTIDEREVLLAAADVVTLCRTGVDYDYRGAVIDAHAPEMPTRFAKQLVQVLRGACAVGLSRPDALRLALRCARDSMPPLRLAILEDVAANPHSRTKDIRYRLNKPYTTVDRQLQALHMLGVLDCDELEDVGKQRSVWYYDVAETINFEALTLRNPNTSVRSVPDLLPPTQRHREEEGRIATHISGTAPSRPNGRAVGVP
jgi:hypothetical protein